MPFTPPQQDGPGGYITLGPGAPTYFGDTPWANLGVHHQVERHTGGEDPETARRILELYEAMSRSGPIARFRDQVNQYLAGQPVPVLAMVADLSRTAYAAASIANALYEVTNRIAANGDTPLAVRPSMTPNPGPSRVVPT